MTQNPSKNSRVRHVRAKSLEGEEMSVRQLMERHEKERVQKVWDKKVPPKPKMSPSPKREFKSGRTSEIDETWLKVSSFKGKLDPEGRNDLRRLQSAPTKAITAEIGNEQRQSYVGAFKLSKSTLLSKKSLDKESPRKEGRFKLWTAKSMPEFSEKVPIISGHSPVDPSRSRKAKNGWSDGWLLPKLSMSPDGRVPRQRKNRIPLSLFGKDPFRSRASAFETLDKKGDNLDHPRTNVQSLVKRDRATIATHRLRREELTSVKHDKLFSDWRILVGPTDWTDFNRRKDGAIRYRTFNLPQTYFGPGVYELGIVDEVRLTGRRIKPGQVVPVYVGQAENIRQRLQQYGQGGSHLGYRAKKTPDGVPGGNPVGFRKSPREEIVDSVGTPPPGFGGRAWQEEVAGNLTEMELRRRSCELKGEEIEEGLLFAFQETSSVTRKKALSSVFEAEEELLGPGLFTDVFERGYSMAFRWAKASSKDAAMEAEAKLLDVFDYPWNQRMNGSRRPHHAFFALESKKRSSMSFFCFGPPVVGTVITAERPSEATDSVNVIATAKIDRQSNGDKRVTARPTRLMYEYSVNSPRSEHGAGRSPLHVAVSDYSETYSGLGSPLRVCTIERISPREAELYSSERGKRDGFMSPNEQSRGGAVCGAGVEDGSTCMESPVSGRKRCSLHKGMKVSPRVLV